MTSVGKTHARMLIRGRSRGILRMLNLFNNALGVRYNGEYGLLRTVAS